MSLDLRNFGTNCYRVAITATRELNVEALASLRIRADEAGLDCRGSHTSDHYQRLA